MERQEEDFGYNYKAYAKETIKSIVCDIKKIKAFSGAIKTCCDDIHKHGRFMMSSINNISDYLENNFDFPYMENTQMPCLNENYPQIDLQINNINEVNDCEIFNSNFSLFAKSNLDLENNDIKKEVDYEKRLKSTITPLKVFNQAMYVNYEVKDLKTHFLDNLTFEGKFNFAEPSPATSSEYDEEYEAKQKHNESKIHSSCLKSFKIDEEDEIVQENDSKSVLNEQGKSPNKSNINTNLISQTKIDEKIDCNKNLNINECSSSSN